MGGPSASGSSLDMSAGIQYWRIRFPIAVPGPTRQSSSLSSFESIAVPPAPRRHGRRSARYVDPTRADRLRPATAPGSRASNLPRSSGAGQGAASEGGCAMETIDTTDFHSNHYLRLNQRRLEHLASLDLHLSGRTVLELGAGIGDLSPFFLDRECAVTSVDARPENLERMAGNIRDYYAFYSRSTRPLLHQVLTIDLDKGQPLDLGRFEIVFCYGLLYHVRDPARLIRLMAAACDGLCLVEACVSYGSDEAVHPTPEDPRWASQSFHGMGCRPTRPWIHGMLRRAFPYVYV